MVEQWKVLFVKGYPLGQQYTIPLENERAVTQLVELNEQVTDLSVPRPKTGDAAAAASGDQQKPAEPVQEVPMIPDVILQAVDALDEEEFLSYLKGANTWAYTTKPGSADPVKQNEHLSKLVDGLFQIISKEEPKTHVTKLSPFPLKLVLLGKQFSGKHTVAEKLAEYCNLKVLEVNSVIEEAIK
jgi:hypothetical protein